MTHMPNGSRWIFAAAAAACLTFGGATAAQAEDGSWYIGANMPLMFIDDTDSTSTGSFAQGQPGQPPVEYRATVRTEHDTGFKLGGVIGRHLDSGLRVEGEVFFARAKVSKLTHSSITVPALSFTLDRDEIVDVAGSADQFGAMVNLWYDIDTGEDWTPYIGGGLGFIRVDQGDVRYDTGAVAEAVANALGQAQAGQQGIPPELVPHVDIPDGFVPTLSSTDTAFAYQIGVGVGYALSDTATLQIGYRLQNVNGLGFSGANAMASVSSNTDLRIHFLEIGVRHLF